jgi:L-lysine 2,3-aminomutase
MLITLLDVQPFYIYPLDEEEAHLCPVRAMAEWIKASKITSGFLFRRFMAQDRPSAHEDTAMVSFYVFFLERSKLVKSQVDF